MRHIKGSHIVVPRVHEGDHAYILQNADKRIVFVIPYEDRYSLIGTTDVPVEAYEAPRIDPEEIDYLLELANTYLARPIQRDDIVWTYSGVRPLYDDGSADPSAITRDYVLELDTGANGGGAPLLSIYGGKITTYRKLAEQALDHLARFLPRAEAAMDGACGASGRRPACRRAPRVDRGARAAPPRGAGRDRARTRATTRNTRASRSWATRAVPPIWASSWATVSPKPRSRISCATSGRARATTCCGGEPSAGSG